MPQRAETRLKIRLVNQRRFIRTDDGDGVNCSASWTDAGGAVELMNPELVLRLESCREIWARISTEVCAGSGCKPGKDCTTNVVTTAEKRAACTTPRV
jgi:hypothetical protein